MVIMDENLQVLKILSDIAETTFRSRKSTLARIKASGFTPEAEEKLIKSIVTPLDDSLDYLSSQVLSTLTICPAPKVTAETITALRRLSFAMARNKKPRKMISST